MKRAGNQLKITNEIIIAGVTDWFESTDMKVKDSQPTAATSSHATVSTIQHHAITPAHATPSILPVPVAAVCDGQSGRPDEPDTSGILDGGAKFCNIEARLQHYSETTLTDMSSTAVAARDEHGCEGVG